MTKAAFITIGVVLLAGLAPLPAQETPINSAIDEAVRRQANTIKLRQTLVDAKSALVRDDSAMAVKLYQEAWNLVQAVGPANVPTEARDAAEGLVALRLEFARAAQKAGNYREADKQVSSAIKVDPSNEEALEFKAKNDRILDSRRGLDPSQETLDQWVGAEEQRVTAATLVQDARVLLDMGKIDEAEAKLAESLKLNPGNRAAIYYVALAKEQRYNKAKRRRDLDVKESLLQVEQAWQLPQEGKSLLVPNPAAGTNLIYTGKGRQAIVRKLDIIQMDNIGFEGLPLSEVVRVLQSESRKRDPERRGINFLIDPQVPSSPLSATPTIDPITGAPVFAGPSAVDAVDVSSIAIKLYPELTDVRLADALDAIVRVAEQPIKYSIEDYAVVFSLKGIEPIPMSTRIFKVNPNTFYQGLESVGAIVFGATDTGTGGGGGGRGGGGGGRGGGGGGRGGGGGTGGTGTGNDVIGAIVARVNVAGGNLTGGGQGGGGGVGGQGGGQGGEGGLRFITRTNSAVEVSAAVRDFFVAIGIDMTPPKAVFFNDTHGEILVRATPDDLDLIERAIQVLNRVPSQVNIKAKFVEITQLDNRALGFDWYLGNFLIGGNKVGGQGGTAPSFESPSTDANPLGLPFPNPAVGANSTDQLLTGGLRNSQIGSTLFTLTGIMTEPQFRAVLKALDQRSGVELMSAPEVTVISGRQAQMKATEVKTVIVDFDFDQAVGGTGVGTGGGGL